MLLKRMPVVAVVVAACLTLALAVTTADLPGNSSDAMAATKSIPAPSAIPSKESMAQAELPPEAPVEDVASEIAATPSPLTKTFTFGRGDTLGGLLDDGGLPSDIAHLISKAIAKVYSVRRIRPGQELELTFSPGDTGDSEEILDSVILKVDPRTEVEVRPTDDGFSAQRIDKDLAREVVRAGGAIDDSLYMAAQNAGVPAPVIADLIRIFSWDVDFQRDIRTGDSFDLVFERMLDDAGEVVDSGNVLAAVLTLSGTRNVLYRHITADGQIDYYDEQGRSARKSLLRTPINGARLSSGFGQRRHPILGYTKMHKGVDFAAPTGTPIYAAGDGTVAFRDWKGGYGRYLQIRHTSSYATAYGHMSDFARGVGVGTRVRQGQVVGYVGTTGRSTGPHLHFEILKDDQHVNPLSVRMPSGRKLAGKELAVFQKARAERDAQWAELALQTKLASAE